MPEFTVKGERAVDGVWESFEATASGETKAEARWSVRREAAPGSPGAEIEKLPPNPEREAAEINETENPRTTPRTEGEQDEYERLVETVRIESVEEVTS